MSAAANKPKSSSAGAGLPLAANAPSVTLPLAFMLTGVLALALGAVWLVLEPNLLATYHYNQSVIAVTHLFVLGWICSIVMGAMYQLVPVALETRLYSERLARWHFAFHLVGFAGMVWMFRAWNLKQVGHFGSALAFGVVLFGYNIVRTLRRAPRWNVTAGSVAAALFWIGFAVTAGLSLAIAKCSYDSTQGLAAAHGLRAFIGDLRSVAAFVSHFDAISAMHAHAHLGAVGFFVMLIVGVSYKLVPMFTLSEIQSKRRAVASLVLLNVALAGAFVTILLRSPWKPVFAGLGVAALALFGWELYAIIRARKRKTLDWGIKYFLTAISLLVPVSLLALVLSWPRLPLTVFTGQLENLYGFLGLLGVVSFAIFGMLYKIIPFLVWYARYSREIGRAKVPALAELYSSRLQAAGYWTFLAGLAVTGTAAAFSHGLGVRVGCSLLAFAVATLVINVGLMLSHLVKGRSRPLAMPTQSIPKPA